MITITQTYAGNFIVPPAIANRRSQGIPPGGPADPFLSTLALHLANTNTCLEITSPLTLTTTEPTQIALAAPPNSHCLANHPTTSLALIPLLPGERLTIQSPQSGYRVYLAWPDLKSPSRFPAQLSPNTRFQSQPNSNPKLIAFDPPHPQPTDATLTYLPILELSASESENTSSLRRQGSHPESFRIICQVTPHISRIGTRLTTLPEQHGDLNKTIAQLSQTQLPRSEPSIHGAIQVTPDAQLLIHGPDGPTLGGYPKLGAITQSSLPKLAQLRPTQTINLTLITLEGANQSHNISQQKLIQILAKIDQALRIARS